MDVCCDRSGRRVPLVDPLSMPGNSDCVRDLILFLMAAGDAGGVTQLFDQQESYFRESGLFFLQTFEIHGECILLSFC